MNLLISRLIVFLIGSSPLAASAEQGLGDLKIPVLEEVTPGKSPFQGEYYRESWADPYRGIDPPKVVIDVETLEKTLLASGIQKQGSLFYTERNARLYAIEAQNWLRDRLAKIFGKMKNRNIVDVLQTPEYNNLTAQLSELLQNGELEFENLDLSAVNKAHFIVYLDLDETFLDRNAFKAEEQMAGGLSSCGISPDDIFSWMRRGKVVNGVVAPGAIKFLADVKALGGVTVIYTRSMDAEAFDFLTNIKVGNTSLLNSGLIAGVFTNSHLVQLPDEKVVEASKDLRILDAFGERSFIVDDNPRHVLQANGTRYVRKFDAFRYCNVSPKNGEQVLSQAAFGVSKLAYEQSFPKIIEEIKDSLKFSRSNNTSFADAYLPFTISGQRALFHLQESGITTADELYIEMIRQNPRLVDVKFF